MIVSIDRWIRTRYPFKAGAICTVRNALFVVGVLVIIASGLHSHILTPQFAALIPGLSVAACGPRLTNIWYFTFYYMKWSIIQVRKGKVYCCHYWT